MSLKYDPNKNLDNKESATYVTKIINDAYIYLMRSPKEVYADAKKKYDDASEAYMNDVKAKGITVTFEECKNNPEQVRLLDLIEEYKNEMKKAMENLNKQTSSPE